MMEHSIEPLLRTKFFAPPPRSGIVTRPRLILRLNVGLQRPLTLVSAPPGFGKTTLLSEWINQKAEGKAMKDELETQLRSPRVAWLSLDSGDNEPIRFWCYVMAALQTVETSLGHTVLVALQLPEPPPLEPLLTALINDITGLSTNLVLVLDDYHLIEAAPIHQGLNFLLDHLPPQLRLIITTRADPPLDLARRRTRTELAEIRTADLCFTDQEATEFLNAQMNLALSTEDIAALAERVEGWIAGLQIAALSLQTLSATEQRDFIAAFAGDDRYIIDYLMEEVLHRQPPPLQTFLRQTSILSRLCEPLCVAVTGRQNSQAILEHLERANLFLIPLDNRRYWYRYHQLFADLLRQSLSHTQTASEIAQLHHRASKWYESEGYIAGAVTHALKSSDFEYAAELIERHVLALFYRSEIILVHNWLQALPPEVIHTHPLLCAVYANTTVLVSAYSPDSLVLAEQWLQAGENALAASSVETDVATSFMANSRAFMARFRGDDPQTVIELSQQALARLPEDNLQFRSALILNLAVVYLIMGHKDAAYRAFGEARQIGQRSNDLYNALTAAYFQTRILRKQGRWPEINSICQQTLQEIVKPAEQAGNSLPAAGAIYIAWGDLLRHQNQLDEAAQALSTGLELLKLTSGLNSITRDGYQALAQVRQAQGDTVQAQELAARAEELSLQITSSAPYLQTWPATPFASASVVSFQPQSLAEPLTSRELEILQLVAAGATNPDIAQELVITVNTVKKHITNIFGKLGVTTRTQAVARARRLDLLG